MKYNAVYKCPLCGTKIVYGESYEIPRDELPNLLGMVVQNQMFMNNPALYVAPMYLPHKCKDGSAGLAQFSGFECVK